MAAMCGAPVACRESSASPTATDSFVSMTAISPNRPMWRASVRTCDPTCPAPVTTSLFDLMTLYSSLVDAPTTCWRPMCQPVGPRDAAPDPGSSCSCRISRIVASRSPMAASLPWSVGW